MFSLLLKFRWLEWSNCFCRAVVMSKLRVVLSVNFVEAVAVCPVWLRLMYL